jgi:hypothetical protein
MSATRQMRRDQQIPHQLLTPQLRSSWQFTGYATRFPRNSLTQKQKKRAERLASMGEYSKAVTALSAGKVADPP